jgi:hypothetical protein
LSEYAFGFEPRKSPSKVIDWPEPRGSVDSTCPRLDVPKFRSKVAYPSEPTWAANWDDLITRYKDNGATGAVRQALWAAREADLRSLREGLETAGAEDSLRYERAWKAFHPHWIERIAIEVAADAQPASRSDPYSRRSLKASLSPGEQRTWEAVRKILTRPSKSSGKRKRRPSREKLAVQELFKRNKRHEILIRHLIVEGERLPAIAHQQGTTPQALMKQFRNALARVQKAIDGAKQNDEPPLSVLRKPPYRV